MISTPVGVLSASVVVEVVGVGVSDSSMLLSNPVDEGVEDTGGVTLTTGVVVTGGVVPGSVSELAGSVLVMNVGIGLLTVAVIVVVCSADDSVVNVVGNSDELESVDGVAWEVVVMTGDDGVVEELGRTVAVVISVTVGVIVTVITVSTAELLGAGVAVGELDGVADGSEEES